MGRRVLVCDDERHIARLIQVNLERQGYTVVCAYDGAQALKQLEELDDFGRPRFDLVVLDVMMPIMDGFDVLKWIRTTEYTRDLRVVMMTAKNQDRMVLDQLPYRPDKYVSKPFNPLELQF